MLGVPENTSIYLPKIDEKMSLNNVSLSKNTDSCSLEHRFAENGISLYLSEFPDSDCLDLDGSVGAGVIQFYFALEGEFTFSFGPHYQKQLQADHYFFFFNPDKDLRFKVTSQTSGRWVAMYLTLEKLHGLFISDTNEIGFLQGDNAKKTLYDEKELGAEVKWALESLFTTKLDRNSLRIFSRGKILEVIALHFAQKPEDGEACPFLRDEANRSKIKEAKRILTERLQEPPTIAELAEEVGISEYKLKAGFKEVYGNTVGGFLLEYKLNTAKALLDKGHLQVSEVAYALGYGNPSHFITAFKKRFNITPKKYLQQT